jgi:hypothetical protein
MAIATSCGARSDGSSPLGADADSERPRIFVTVLRPLFVLDPTYTPPVSAGVPIALVLAAAAATSIAASRLVSRLEPTELLRDE